MTAPATSSRLSDRRLFLIAAIAFPLIVLAGFGRTYYFTALVGGPPVPSLLVHAHGLVMTLWVALFVTQVWLVRTARRTVHMALGMYGAALALAVVVVGFFTAAAAAKFGSVSTPPDIPPLVFLIVPMTDLLLFVGFFGAAFLLRRRPADHKRLMLLTAINFLPPALGRLPTAAVLGPSASLVIAFGVPVSFVLAAVAYDRYRSGRWSRVLLAGGAVLIASFPLRVAMSETNAWLAVATWIVSWAA
jgi:hypothetical protein